MCSLLTLAMLVTLTMAMSPRKLQRHVYIYSADLQRNTELLMFFRICCIVCLHKSCDYISIGEITNMNHKCISLSKLSFGYQFFFVAL